MSTQSTNSAPAYPDGPTGKLCEWISKVSLADVPEEIITRAKYLLLDGIACGLVGAHLPWSSTAANTLFEIDPTGNSTIIGWDRKTTPLTAALLNSTFVQGFELDDYHSTSPLHSNSIVLPALLAAAEHLHATDPSTTFSGSDMLLATIVGFEVGPRVGLSLYGADVLTRGWHSGAVFGPSASAAAVCKLAKLQPNMVEDALGTACTQAGGLMSAQFGSDAKRMQHGFAARNGLLGALLARKGYTGIKRVYEEPYGGYCSMFGSGSGKNPESRPEEVAKDLGEIWQTAGIIVKAHAAMGFTNCTVDCMKALQDRYPEQMADLDGIESITIEMSEASLGHGGQVIHKPVSALGAQMSIAYVGATQLVDNQVSPSEFRHECLDRDMIWNLVKKTTCKRGNNGKEVERMAQRITITFKNGQAPLVQTLPGPRGVVPPLKNEEIVEKWRRITANVIDDERRANIEKVVLELDKLDDAGNLITLLAKPTKNPIE